MLARTLCTSRTAISVKCPSAKNRLYHWSAALRRSNSVSFCHNGVDAQDGKEVDAILILGGGLLPDGGLPLSVIRRLEKAVELSAKVTNNVPILCLGGGTPYRPAVISPEGHVVHESTACTNALMQAGLPPQRLLKEVSSYDTVGNAYFALTIHAVPAGWKSLAVITSAFHMPRTQAIFTDMASVVDKSVYNATDRFKLSFHPVDDEGVFPPDVLEVRRTKEAAALEQWKNNKKCFDNLAELHAWFYSTHLCYSVSRQDEYGQLAISDPVLLASY